MGNRKHPIRRVSLDIGYDSSPYTIWMITFNERSDVIKDVKFSSLTK